jgi:hypothetical protein
MLEKHNRPFATDWANQPAAWSCWRDSRVEAQILLDIGARVGDNLRMQIDQPKSDPPKRKRRRFQFSLRSLLIVVTLLAVTCAYVGWQAKIVRERKETMTELLRSLPVFDRIQWATIFCESCHSTSTPPV